MIIGILSDTHNHIENTRRALEVFADQGIERIVHCGDITTPQIVRLFQGWQGVFVFGNIDHNHADMMLVAKEWLGIGSIGYSYTGSWDGIRVAVCHGHELDRLEALVQSGVYQYVFHGHTHLRRDDLIGSTRVINPGAIGGKKKQSRSVCILDTESGQARFLSLEGD